MLEKEDLMDRVAVAVRNLRSTLNLTQSEFADCVGIDRTAVCKVESGLRELRLSEVMRLSDHTGMSLDSLLNTKDPSPPIIPPSYHEQNFKACQTCVHCGTYGGKGDLQEDIPLTSVCYWGTGADEVIESFQLTKAKKLNWVEGRKVSPLGCCDQWEAAS